VGGHLADAGNGVGGQVGQAFCGALRPFGLVADFRGAILAAGMAADTDRVHNLLAATFCSMGKAETADGNDDGRD